MNDPFTMVELERALAGCKEKSSPRLDNVEYKMLKKLPDFVKVILLDRLNYAFVNGYLFGDWKNLQTIFIGKKDRKKVRHITMSSCVGKLIERMINERIIWLSEREKWFDKDQSGFKRRRSCVDNLVRLVFDIEISKVTN